MNEMWQIFVFFATLETALSIDHYYRDPVPRFKTPHNSKHEVYLGDKLRLNCQAISKSPVDIEWFRNGRHLEHDFDKLRVHKDRRTMSLEINRVDVSDQGTWACRVFNAVAQISRNFSVEIIDFCDYFLLPGIDKMKIPMECVCLWRYTREAQLPDIDFTVATEQACSKYASHMISRARKPFPVMPCFSCNDKDDPSPTQLPNYTNRSFPHDPIKLFDWLTERGVEDVGALLPQLVPFGESRRLREQLVGWKQLSSKQKLQRARQIIKMRTEQAIEDDYIEDEKEYIVKETISPDSTPEMINRTEHVPIFKEVDANKTTVLPAGRTLRLSCRAEGYPEPRVVWYKDTHLITKDSMRSNGAEYKLRRWTLELDDVIEADSGSYFCEAWNYVGAVNKTYAVTIVNRMRRPPFIVPNILKNQTVNVNGTARFTCKVVSDLVPHIMWVRVNKVNGSYHYFNETAKEFMFKYTEVEKLENAHVHHRGDESSLTLTNVTISDQGLYACLSGNSLGTTMANATLTVNDYIVVNLLTGDAEPEYSVWSVVLTSGLLLLVILLLLIITATFAYLMWRGHQKKYQEDRVNLMPKKKKVIITHKKPTYDKDGIPDMPPSYQIQIIEEPLSANGISDMKRRQVGSESAVLSEYEVSPDPTWEVDRNRLRLVDVLGEGAFGEVWRAMMQPEEKDDWKEEKPVAVKKLKNSAHEKELIDLVSEMETLKAIGFHENLLRLIGCCTGWGPLYVVLELCKHGNLRDFLRAHRPKDEKTTLKKISGDLADYMEPRRPDDKQDTRELINNLTQRHLVHFAWQIARGMSFMTSKKIIHRDLAARNVLVADNYVMKISDFGLSRDLHDYNYYRKKGTGRLPIKWMALEALDSHLYTVGSDVWSFGILLWEIMTLGGTPYPTIAMPQLYSTLKEGYRMESPHNCPEEVYNIMVACWQEKRENRPCFATIVDYLDWMLMQPADVPSGDTTNTGHSLDDMQMNQSLNSISGFPKPRRHRPLSAPVSLPSNSQHKICDDDDQEHIGLNSLMPDPNYSNELLVPRHCILPRQQTDPGSQTTAVVRDVFAGECYGYVRPAALTRVSNVANQSLDSAIGSPAWHTHERTSNNNLTGGAFLGAPSTTPHNCNYINLYPNTFHLTCFNFAIDANDENLNRSKDSAICDVCNSCGGADSLVTSICSHPTGGGSGRWSSLPLQGAATSKDGETIV